MKTVKVEYAGADLEAMNFAENYHRWILDLLKPFLGKHLVEVGAGLGSFSEMLLEGDPNSLSLVEPSELYGQLSEAFAGNGHRTIVDTYHSIFADVRDEITSKNIPDSIIYINVLEHIEDDEGELRLIYQTLRDGGKCFIFVPALPILYGNFDRKLGHFRRYRKHELEAKCEAAGFKLLKSTYFDLPGIIPWFVKYRIFRSDELGSRAVNLYDRLVVPIARKIESIIKVPIGKNILLIAEKQ